MLNKIKQLFTLSYILTVHMKSGKSITCKCKNFTIGRKGNELMSYNIELSKDYPDYICLSEVEAITSVKTYF